MNTNKTADPPQQNNRAETGQRQRDDKGKFVRGNKNGGRPKLREEFKRFAQEKSLEALQVVMGIMVNAARESDRLTAARIMLEYGYGRPAAEYDRERLDLEVKRLDMDEKSAKGDSTINVIMSDELRELAQ